MCNTMCNNYSFGTYQTMLENNIDVKLEFVKRKFNFTDDELGLIWSVSRKTIHNWYKKFNSPSSKSEILIERTCSILVAWMKHGYPTESKLPVILRQQLVMALIVPNVKQEDVLLIAEEYMSNFTQLDSITVSQVERTKYGQNIYRVVTEQTVKRTVTYEVLLPQAGDDDVECEINDLLEGGDLTPVTCDDEIVMSENINCIINLNSELKKQTSPDDEETELD
ncbi:hypothetical protein [Photobacterium leiognathi]|uniref:hypothetical protein n=2 Tax=Photobacterium leiognathi TaxID=553611 RepID=UPI002980E963|nr:hypothetical protein [Photobacterium leiognathi]